jgi:ribosomal protein L16/L10AE
MDSEIKQMCQQKITTVMLEPIRKVWIHEEAFAASRLSMMRIMARRTNAATVAA